MRIWKRLFGAKSAASDARPPDRGQLLIVPVPAFVAVLAHLENEKGAPLTEIEVSEARDAAVCIVMPEKARDEMAEARGYADIDMENAWAEWQVIRQTLPGNDS